MIQVLVKHNSDAKSKLDQQRSEVFYMCHAPIASAMQDVVRFVVTWLLAK
jgi:hypothetical protein